MTTVPPQNAPLSVVLGTLLNGTKVAVRVPAEGCTTCDFIRALEASTGQANVFWLVLWGTQVLARAADKYLEHPDHIDEMPSEGLTFLKHQHKLSERADLLCDRVDACLAERNDEYHAIVVAAWAKCHPGDGWQRLRNAIHTYEHCSEWETHTDFVLILGGDPRSLFRTWLARRSSKDFALVLVELSGQALMLRRNFCDDQEVVERAVRNDGKALEHASDSLRDNESIVAEAVRQQCEALRFASDRLQDNEQIVEEAARHHCEALRFASDRLRDNEQIVKEADRHRGEALLFARDRLQDDETIVTLAVHHSGEALHYASSRLQDNDAIVKQCPQALHFASKRVRLLVAENKEEAKQKRRRIDQ